VIRPGAEDICISASDDQTIKVWKTRKNTRNQQKQQEQQEVVCESKKAKAS